MCGSSLARELDLTRSCADALDLSRARPVRAVSPRHHPPWTENSRGGGSIPSLATHQDNNLGDFGPPGTKASRGTFRGTCSALGGLSRRECRASSRQVFGAPVLVIGCLVPDGPNRGSASPSGKSQQGKRRSQDEDQAESVAPEERTFGYAAERAGSPARRNGRPVGAAR